MLSTKSIAAMALAAGALASAQAQSGRFEVAGAGCAMAHCDSRLSDRANTSIPAFGSVIAVDTVPQGGGGVGCVSNLTIVACSYRGDPTKQSNIVVYDADGHRLWEDHGVFGWQAWMSAPILGIDGSVIAADQDWVMRVQPATNTVLWKVAKPDPGTPVSPVVIGTDPSMLFLATKDNLSGGEPAMTVWDTETGALLSQLPLRDAVTGGLYITFNTVAVSGNRAYVLASRIDDDTDGRLVAIDVCNAASCGGRGKLSQAWSYSFKGPSGVSPLLIGSTIYFDGKVTSRAGTLIAVQDHGTSARRVWRREFRSTFGVSPAHDPRGGLWVHYRAPDGRTLMRLGEDDGALVQEINVSTVLGVEPGYVAYTVITLAQTGAGAGAGAGAVAMLIGAQPGGSGSAPTYMAAIDVSSTPGGTLLWKTVVAADKDTNAASGQFPIVVNAAGARRVVFEGSKRWTYFVGEP